MRFPSPAAATPWPRSTSTASPARCPTSPPAAARSSSFSKARPCRRWPPWNHAPTRRMGPGAARRHRAGLGWAPSAQAKPSPMSEHRRRTRILATLGPATDAPGVLDALLQAGVDVVRLNFSHGDPAAQAARAQAVREAAARVGKEVGILADLPGPKIRVETFADGPVTLGAGERFDLVASADAPPGDASQVGVSYLELPRDLSAGDILLLDDGVVQLEVERIEGE